MNDNPIRAALVALIKSNRRKMSRAQRRRGIKPQRWLYPWAAERYYAAAVRAWLRPMKEYVHQYLKENQEAILRGDSAGFTADSLSVSRLDTVPGKSFKRMIDSLNGWVGQYVPDDDDSKSGSPIYMGLGRIADSAFDFNEGQYEKGAKSVLGVEFPVGEDWWPFARDIWANQNYDLIRGDMRKYIGQVNDLTEKAVTSGLSVKELAKQIQGLDDKTTKSRAEFIARDQMGKLNGQITQRRMESVGLTMYIWETSGDERVRPSHEKMDGRLCRWDDPTVYSEDGGKTWIDRPADAVRLHPGMDYQCRCTATAFWDELVGEADAALDYEGAGTAEEEAKRGLEHYKLEETRRAAEAARKSAKRAAGQNKAESKEKRRREENAGKAKEAADRLFPGEKWKKADDGIYLSSRRPVGAKTNFKDEKHDALILTLLGSIVYLVPEARNVPGKKYDAIVNGERFEFKNMKGASVITLKDHFLKSREQAPNVFINLENSPLTKDEIIRTLYRARNSEDYKKHNMFKGGKIILKIKGHQSLIYLNVDDLKASRQ
jgi:SPP1 gp7 family putative phage head morphogenesis protein